MLTRIEIDGFKSFTNFAMDFSPLTVIAGLNASGKSNLFDALHLLSLLAEYDLNTAFDKVQRGRNLELFTQYADGRVAEEMRFAVEVEVVPEVFNSLYGSRPLVFTKLGYLLRLKRLWDQQGTGSSLCVIEEKFAPVGYDAAVLVGPRFIEDNSCQTPETVAPFVYYRANSQGVSETGYLVWDESLPDLRGERLPRSDTPLGSSITSLNWVTSVHVHGHLFALKLELMLWQFIRLDPAKIPNPSPAQAFGLPGPLNASADNLAAVLWRIRKTDEYLLTRITQRLASLVPGIKEIVVRHDDYYNQYRVFVHTTAGQRFPLHMLSEGTLRMLALCTLVFDPEQKGLVGLEEVENGVHPARLKDIAALLRDLSSDPTDTEGPLRQVIVNTHSPGLVKACLEAVAGPERRASGLTVWFSQLVSRPVEEDGKRTTRRVTHMVPVSLDPAAPQSADPQKRVGLYQLVSYLESTNPDDLLDSLGLQSIADAL